MNIGDIVKLKETVKHTCPEGREDNSTSTIKCIFGEKNDQIMTSNDLHGCRYWNENDLDVVN